MDHAHSARAISSPRGQPPLWKPTHSLRAALWARDESSALAALMPETRGAGTLACLPKVADSTAFDYPDPQAGPGGR